MDAEPLTTLWFCGEALCKIATLWFCDDSFSMKFSILFWGLVGVFFECACEVALGSEAEKRSDGERGFVGVLKQALGFFDFLLQNKVVKRYARFGFEFRAQARSVYEKMICYIGGRYFFGKMVADVV